VSRITVGGLGAVSAAGWGVDVLMEALDSGRMPVVSELERERGDGSTVTTRVMRVPKEGSTVPRHPRLRRASPAGKFAAAAAAEALGEERLEASRSGDLRVGVICTMMNGCVNYSNRFFGEVLRDPGTASPILFPETVYNAPSSHLSALIGSTAPNDTLVGDGAEFFSGLELAAEWLGRGDCDACLLVAPEEVDWLSAEALGYYDSRMIASEGAAALLLERDGDGPVLHAVPDPVSYAEEKDRVKALRMLWDAMGVEDDGATLLGDGRSGIAGVDAVEDEVLAGWTGPIQSSRKIVGETLGAAAGVQTVAALEAMRRGLVEKAVVLAVGGNEGVGGAVFGGA
jgi:hypothetical protein